MEREANFLMSKPESEIGVLYVESETAAYVGQFSRARELAKRVVEALRQKRQKDRAGAYEVQAALREALIGNLPLAKAQVEDALTLSQLNYVQGVSAIVLALAGDAVKATQLADDLTTRFPENTMIRVHYQPMARGVIALKEGNTGKAIEAFSLDTYELGMFQWMSFVNLYPAYLHGLALLAAHQGATAVEENSRRFSTIRGLS